MTSGGAHDDGVHGLRRPQILARKAALRGQIDLRQKHLFASSSASMGS